MKIFKVIQFTACAFALSVLPSCHCDHDTEPKAPFKLGHVLCTDGTVMSLCDYIKSEKEAVGIVFNVSETQEDGILGHAVYIHKTDKVSFADECGTSQSTSASLTDWDGNSNTYAIHMTDDVHSELADLVFDLWPYGQSAYIPSVAELRQLYSVKDFVNLRIEAVGGEPIFNDDENCWLWSSTEVENQTENKAWLFSMNYGDIQETPKNQKHQVRPIITIRR